MICFRDMTYCSAECMNDECERTRQREAIDRRKYAISLPTAWADFSDGCPDFIPMLPGAA